MLCFFVDYLSFTSEIHWNIRLNAFSYYIKCIFKITSAIVSKFREFHKPLHDNIRIRVVSICVPDIQLSPLARVCMSNTTRSLML